MAGLRGSRDDGLGRAGELGPCDPAARLGDGPAARRGDRVTQIVVCRDGVDDDADDDDACPGDPIAGGVPPPGAASLACGTLEARVAPGDRGGALAPASLLRGPCFAAVSPSSGLSHCPRPSASL